MANHTPYPITVSHPKTPARAETSTLLPPAHTPTQNAQSQRQHMLVARDSLVFQGHTQLFIYTVHLVTPLRCTKNKDKQQKKKTGFRGDSSIGKHKDLSLSPKNHGQMPNVVITALERQRQEEPCPPASQLSLTGKFQASGI